MIHDYSRTPTISPLYFNSFTGFWYYVIWELKPTSLCFSRAEIQSVCCTTAPPFQAVGMGKVTRIRWWQGADRATWPPKYQNFPTWPDQVAGDRRETKSSPFPLPCQQKWKWHRLMRILSQTPGATLWAKKPFHAGMIWEDPPQLDMLIRTVVNATWVKSHVIRRNL